MDKKILIGGGVAVAALLFFAKSGNNSGGNSAQYNAAVLASNANTNQALAAAQPANAKTKADLMAHLSDNKLATFNSSGNFLLSALDMNNQTTAVNAAALDKLRERSQVMPLAKLNATSGANAAIELEKIKGANDLAIAQLGFNPAGSLFGGGQSTYSGQNYSQMNDWEKNIQAAVALNNSNHQQSSSSSSNSWIGSAISGIVSLVGSFLA